MPRETVQEEFHLHLQRENRNTPTEIQDQQHTEAGALMNAYSKLNVAHHTMMETCEQNILIFDNSSSKHSELRILYKVNIFLQQMQHNGCRVQVAIFPVKLAGNSRTTRSSALMLSNI